MTSTYYHQIRINRRKKTRVQSKRQIGSEYSHQSQCCEVLKVIVSPQTGNNRQRRMSAETEGYMGKANRDLWSHQVPKFLPPNSYLRVTEKIHGCRTIATCRGMKSVPITLVWEYTKRITIRYGRKRRDEYADAMIYGKVSEMMTCWNRSRILNPFTYQVESVPKPQIGNKF